MADVQGLVCATRAIKNAIYLQRVAPHIMPKDEPADGFGSVIPMPILASIHRPDAHGWPNVDDRLARDLAAVQFPPIQFASAVPLFNGTLFFVRVHFTVQQQNNAVISVSAADFSTAVDYATRAVIPISQYASGYGPNSVGVDRTVLTFSVTLQDNTYNDAQLRGFVNFIASQASLPSTACVVVLNPIGVVNTTAAAAQGFGGYHLKANIPYIFVNVQGQALAITDPGFAYAGSLSHEIAEMVVDPQANLSNPEVCDPCGPNCVSTYVDYFDSTGTYIATSQQFPPNFQYTFYLNGIVSPAFATQCQNPEVPASACTYPPIALTGSDHFYTIALAERDNAIESYSYRNEGVACYVSAQATAGTVALHRLFNPTSGDHFYTTSDSERDNAIANSGYQSEGEACYVYAGPTAGAVALHRLFRPTGDHFLTISDAERDNAIANYGYQSEGEACFVYSASPANVGPLYRLFRPTGDHFYTMSLEERDNAVAGGYQSEGEGWFAYAEAVAGTTALHRLFNPTLGDHFYTTSDAEMDNAVANGGYRTEGEACFVYAGMTAGATALHRLYNAASGDHFYTTSDAERDNAIANDGYVSEGDACFAYARDLSSTAPLFRLFHEFS